MILSDILYKTNSTSSLNIGSTMNESELSFFTDGSSSFNFPFGKSEKDIVKFSVYDFSETLVSSSYMHSSGTYTSHTQSYFDTLNKNVTYSYDTFVSDWPVLGTVTRSLFFDVTKAMQSLSIPDGNYKVTIEMLRNLVGSEKSSTDKILIDEISNSRDEIVLVPKNLRGDGSSIENDFNIFAENKMSIKDIAQDLLENMAGPSIYSTYYTATGITPTGSYEFKFNYGFTSRLVQVETGSNSVKNYGVTPRNSDMDAISFVTDVYYGVKKGTLRSNGQYAENDILGIYDQFKNWLLLNYEVGISFSEIRNYYYSLVLVVIDQELNRISNKKPDNYNLIVEFLTTIYYNLLFYPQLTDIESKYNSDLSGYFKSLLNISQLESYAIINKKIIVSTDPKFHNKLAIKLSSPLPLRVVVGEDAWITNDFGFLPIVQNLYYFTPQTITTIPLRGPNFLIKIENEGNSTEAVSLEQLINETGSLYEEMVSKVASKTTNIIDNTDYRYFSEFINFSSAHLRVNGFDYKRTQILDLKSTIEEIDAKLLINPIDKFFLVEKDEANSSIDSIESSMDGYEKFLYNNISWYDVHVVSASFYDRDNGNSLINNLPQFIVEDSDQNQDYIVFVGMVGHFFDNISLLVKQFTEKNNYANSPYYGASLSLVGDMLKSLGWEVEISKENLPLLLASFSKRDFDVGTDSYNKAKEYSEEERNQIIWKRILNTLPYIYKTKGTEASLSALFSCFGVPKNILKIKEYGGIQNVYNLEDTSLHIIDEVKYEPYFSGSGEYFQINWTGSAKTFEFNFTFDEGNVNTEGAVFRLVNCSDSWLLGAYRERGTDWGRLFFSLDDGSGSVKTVMTGKAPIFDGNTYHAMIRKNSIHPDFSFYGTDENYPVRYDIKVEKSGDDHITFSSSGSMFFSGSYNSQFSVGDYVYVGNYNQSTASLNVDPEAFFGNIDDIKIWESTLSDARFSDHTLHQNSYNLESPVQMISENLFRISFERPVDLYGVLGVTLNNLSFRKDFPTFTAINFKQYQPEPDQSTECSPSYVSTFPYQFTRKDTRQVMRLPDYGSNKFRSNKINYVEQELVSNLSSDARASMKSSELSSVDSNKLGIFFSPTEIQNSEIIKFFGDYPLGDLIGDPSSVYENSYQRFENFRQMYYDQGFGNMDYQLFMNIVRFYFDKAMFKYIRSIIPARAKLVDGILIEPSILERPKIQFKPLVQKAIEQKVANIIVDKLVVGTNVLQSNAEIGTNSSGISILTDVNQTFYPYDQDQFGIGVFATDGITYYKDEYYRADIIKVKRAYQVYRDTALPKSQVSDYDVRFNLGGITQTITQSFYKINMTKLPVISEYPMTMSLSNLSNISGSLYFSGSVGFFGPARGWGDWTSTSSHTLSGTLSGSHVALSDSRQVASYGFIESSIYSPGLNLVGDFSGNYPVTYSGFFDLNHLGQQTFEGNIYGSSPDILGQSGSLYKIKFVAESPTGSIVLEFIRKTQGNIFGPLGSSNAYKKEVSMENYPRNATLLNGYFPTHYKYGKKQFSMKEVTSYDDENKVSFKWKKSSQNKKTTVDPSSGLLDNTDPVETKTV